MRAIAALAVVLFHIWPSILPGGYVGVDVFFVISGFLITSLLLLEAERDSRIALGKFYLRRSWRLLPLAFTIIFFVIAFTPVFLPPSQWKQVLTESISSALYFQNWHLAAVSVDYLAAEQAPSPLQHYWSLSIEEQFYIFWPSLVAFCVWISKDRALSLKTIFGWVVVASTVTSLSFSIFYALHHGSEGYFLTQARIWELGIGALLALKSPNLREGWHQIGGIVGLLAIIVASLCFSKSTAFPGYSALLPTLGAALIIWSGKSEKLFSSYYLLHGRAFQILGGLSYSIYLWHWPLVIFYRMSFDTHIDAVDGMLLLGTTIGLSYLSKTFIEDCFRHPQMTWAWWRHTAPLASILLIPLIIWGWSYFDISNQMKRIEKNPAKYAGAAALAPNYDSPVDVTGTNPPLALLRFDKDEAYTNGCHLDFKETEPVACNFGNPQSKTKVFLIGDSHAVNWLPALRLIAVQNNWNASSYTKSSCDFIDGMVSRNDEIYTACYEWGKKLFALIKNEKPDLVIVTQMNSQNWVTDAEIGNRKSMVVALTDKWKKIDAIGTKIVAISDTPEWPEDSDVCLYQNAACEMKLPSLPQSDPLANAAREMETVSLINMMEYICPKGLCPAVIGHVIVWRDRHHLTASYSRTLAPFLAAKLKAAFPKTTTSQPK